ncbi:MAG: glycosyl transferase [Acidobacteria bacterium]|nr:glycosyl transferase [Acidobacteriota bacterium]MCI0623826.1 glycosyl transferase [Acidobacteriota bacterium]MCI0719606.1 glycosyl transferase [Acidobacteriota bacterium]
MSDFYQTGVVATLHRLGSSNGHKIARELEAFGRQRPIALVLPALYSEFESEAIHNIIRELAQVKFLNQIVLSLDRAGCTQFHKAKEYLSVLPQNVRVIWNDGPRLAALYRTLEENDLRIGPAGKGRGCWMAYGYVLASQQSDIIAVHDCDILNYSREMLARLCYPIANPSIDFEFCKGFYARLTDRMHGRVTRLLVSPLIRSLTSILGHIPLLVYLDSFRYPLAGEFAMKVDLARANRIPPDWGLEIGMLAEIYRNCAIKRICQVDICDNYEHKHQPLSPDDPESGLLKMTIEIVKILFRTLAAEGIVLDNGVFNSLLVRYVRTAEDTLKRYHADALINGLKFDRHLEEIAVAAFSRGIDLARKSFLEDPLGAPLIPNWNRVIAAIPEFLNRLETAVEQENLPAVKQHVTARATVYAGCG